MQKIIKILGIPLNLGQRKLGVEQGPNAIRNAGLHQALQAKKISFIDDGDIVIPSLDSLSNEASEDLRYRPTIAKISLDVAKWGKQAITDGYIPVFLGGDHSLAIGSVFGVASGVSVKESIGLVWVDAHGDFNTWQTSPSKNIHGMPLASLVGLGHSDLLLSNASSPVIKKENVVIIGARDLDDDEAKLLEEHEIKVYSMDDIAKLGWPKILSDLKEFFSHLDKIHVSYDLDSLDPSFAPGVGTPVNGGLTNDESALLLDTIRSTGKLCSLDVVELNPLLDRETMTSLKGIEAIVRLLSN